MKHKKQKIKKIYLPKPKKKLNEKLNLEQSTMHIIYSSFFVFFAVLFLAAAFQKAGPVGEKIFKILDDFFGIGYYIFPLLFLIIAFIFFKDFTKDFTKVKMTGAAIFTSSALGLIDLITDKAGLFGEFISSIKNYIGSELSGFLFLIFIGISLVILFDGIKVVKRKVEEFSDNLTEDEEDRIDKIEEEAIKKAQTEYNTEKENRKTKKSFSFSGMSVKGEDAKSDVVKIKSDDVSFAESIKNTFSLNSSNVILPPISLLSKDKGKASAGDIKENANIIKNTLSSFGISVEIDSVMVGPTVTRYALKPAQGVKLSKIASLYDNLALALSAKSIVIQAPIPGEALVGIEIPNRNTTMVGAGSLFSSKEFVNTKYILPIAIGKNIAGESELIDLAKAPHMLVAGQTGAGKSVTVHAIIASLLYKYGPDSLKFILIDPKKVEMTLYNGIPHLYTPVITDPKKAILSLRWAISEMERRYDLLEKHTLRDIESYHKNILNKAKENNVAEADMPERMPYIVIVIDELSDIMQQYPKELEAGIVSIAQKARAIGIHLILSTQRPSVNVVTGLIKANIPTRVALAVSSAIDSKTILDMAGAEKLLGKGDMLYKTGSMAKPTRVQSAFISEDEVKKIAKFIKNAYKGELGDTALDFSDATTKHAEEVYESGISSMETEAIAFDELEKDMDTADLDDLFEDARKEVITSGKASTSYLQRKFRIGYSRAASLIDQLEDHHIIGPPNGSKPRDVLIKE